MIEPFALEAGKDLVVSLSGLVRLMLLNILTNCIRKESLMLLNTPFAPRPYLLYFQAIAFSLDKVDVSTPSYLKNKDLK